MPRKDVDKVEGASQRRTVRSAAKKPGHVTRGNVLDDLDRMPK